MKTSKITFLQISLTATLFALFFLPTSYAQMEVMSNGRVEVTSGADATGATNTGAIEIANGLRLDVNEIITNTNSSLYLQHDNNGDLRVDNTTLAVDASTNRVGIGTTAPGYKLDVAGTIRSNEIRDNEGSFITLRTNSGYTEIGAGNASWSHFRTDRNAFWFSKQVSVNGHLYPYGNNVSYCGTNTKRWNRGYFTTIFRVSEQSLSDRSVKENFREIPSALDKVLQLKGLVYDYKKEVFNPQTSGEDMNAEDVVDEEGNTVKRENSTIDSSVAARAEIERKGHVGFIAQDVKEIMPELVKFDEETQLHTMSYSGIIPILVEAIKEQQKQIDELKAELAKKK